MARFSLLYLLWCFLRTSLGVPQTSNTRFNSDLFKDDDCVCVPYYLCVDGEVVTDGTNIINPRLKPQKEELPIEEKYRPPECGPHHVCCANPEHSAVKAYEHHCGLRNPGGVNSGLLRPRNKGEAEFGEWPWQAAVMKKKDNAFVFKCGGTLIDEKHVLTVAHCVEEFQDSLSDIVVRLGEWDVQDEDDKHEDYELEEIFVHPYYKRNNLHNDIAIISLSKNVTFRPHIDTTCLPQDDDYFTGHHCTVTGWGTNAYQSQDFALIMKEISVPVLEHDECQTMLRRTRLGRGFKLYGGFICAGGKKGEDSCKGDGGGPLVCYKDKHYTLVGLVSWGIDCGQPGVPGVYVAVRKYIDWIASTTGKQLEEYWSGQ